MFLVWLSLATIVHCKKGVKEMFHQQNDLQVQNQCVDFSWVVL